MSTTGTAPAAAQEAPSGLTPPAPPRTLATRRRRPALIGLSVALIAAGGLAGAFTVLSSGERTPVLMVAKQIPYGEVVTERDLTVVSIGLDPALETVAAADKDEIVGKRATTDLLAGSLVTGESVTDKPLIGRDQQLVGLRLKPGQLPTTPLTPGRSVLVVSTPDASANTDPEGGKRDEMPKTLPAEVVRVGEPDTNGNLTVDVAVASTDGAVLASRAASGDIALVVEPKKAAG
ncbi:SAF domain-containing protein [Streptomyces sp. OfavH-34-F]|uniref:SAF domain-containing protein n=1 Tax=Streptomyces sp. OfavH-34-F TaxID=2917760 RepID=UPI001EF2AAA8|nr:SAF domain-containing protein [Streptomyces sp. OfavH-34-F]MCG7524563.1 SAF domain-containing protein [Streptomyces sp. OfavH-34-F]